MRIRIGNTNMTTETILNRIRNIKELSEDTGATEGEKANALDKLHKLLEKYNLTLDDLQDNQRQRYDFTYRRKWEKRLLIQIMAYVLESKDFDVWGYTNRDSNRRLQKVGVDLTKTEYEQINRLYTMYKKQFVDELVLLMEAFFERHNIYPPSNEMQIDLSNIDWLRHKRMKNLAKQLESLPTANLQLED